MKCRFHRFFIITAALILVAGCATTKTEKIKALSVYRQETLDHLGRFEFERRLYIFRTIDELASRLRNSEVYSSLKREKTKISEELFEMYPVLELSDRDLDGTADQFAYEPEKGGETNEWGLIFDLNRDGQIDYMVFNCGLVIFGEEFKVGWANYHWIDSNYDGKVDIFVYNNNIKLIGGKGADQGISGWVYDFDFDGAADKAEYLGEDFTEPAAEEEGVFIIKTVFGDKEWAKGDSESLLFPTLLLSDINSVIR